MIEFETEKELLVESEDPKSLECYELAQKVEREHIRILQELWLIELGVQAKA